MKPIPKHHQNFIELVASGKEQYLAYQATAKGKPSKKTCEKNSTRLCHQYAPQIAQARELYQAAIEKARSKSVVKTALKSILHQAEVDSILCSIIRGEFETEKRTFRINLQGEKVFATFKCKPDHSEILKAIDIYNKRFGSYAAEKFNIKTDTLIKFTDAE